MEIEKRSENWKNKEVEIGSKGNLVFEKRNWEINSRDGKKLDPLLSPQDAAEYLGVKRKFIYERIARRELEVQPIGRLKRIRLSNLESWLLREKQRRTS
jgi:excisionase family DNA binding protein